jgi:oxalate decarboxylase
MNSGKNSPPEACDRRGFLTTGTAAITAALVAGSAAGQESEKANDIEKTQRAEHNRSGSDAGPENTKLRDAQPNAFMPPPTDHGETPEFWNTFSAAHRRIQEGGWSRQVTVRDFPLSKDVAGVNMRLTAGGIRELHWHATGEWAIMLSGSARITIIDDQGRGYVEDVTKDDLWYFPKGDPHSIQGLAPDGCEFLLVFDDGAFSEADTTLVSDWTRHTPREVLAKNWGLTESQIAPVYEQPPEGHYIFQTSVPPPLEQDKRAITGRNGLSPTKFAFPLGKMTPTIQTRSGEVRIVDTTNFPVSKTIAAAHVRVKPGGLRELHWHQNADEWDYIISGQGRMTVFFNGSKARTADFIAGDIGVVPKTLGHYVENTGNEDLVFLEMFKTDRYMDLSLSEWLTHIPPELVTQHLGIGNDIISRIPKEKKVIVPA